MAELDPSTLASVNNLNYKSLGEMNVLSYMGAMHGWQRTMTQLGDDARASQQRTTILAENLLGKGVKSIVEMDSEEAISNNAMFTRVDPMSQGFAAQQNGTMYAMLAEILAALRAKA
jgi:hypothetical protein